MAKRVKYKKTYTSLIIKPKEVIRLAQICFEPWKRDLKSAEKKWEKEKLPEVEKAIDQHNKDIKNKKSVYSFNTYLPIDETAKRSIIAKEREFFIHTTQKVYEFQSEFEAEFKGKTISETSPDFLNKIRWEQVKSLSFKTKTKDEKKSVTIEVKTSGWGRGVSYEIGGKDSRWIDKTREEIEDVFEDITKPHPLTYKKTRIAFAISVGTTYTLFSILKKVGFYSIFANKIPLSPTTTLIIILPLAFYLSLYIILDKLGEILPDFAIKEEYEPREALPAKFFFWLIAGVSINAIYDLLRFIFS